MYRHPVFYLPYSHRQQRPNFFLIAEKHNSSFGDIQAGFLPIDIGKFNTKGKNV